MKMSKWIWILLALAVVSFWLCGCTTRAQYQHKWVDANKVPQTINITWSEGVGNTEKTDFMILLPDRALLMFGMATVNQDEWMRTLKQYGITLEKIAEAYMTGPLSAPVYGAGSLTTELNDVSDLKK